MTWHLLNAPFCPNRNHTENLKILNLNTQLHEPSLSSLTHEPSLSSATYETQPSLPNPYEPRPPIGSEPIPCIVNPDGVSSSMALSQLQGSSSSGNGYSQKFSMALFLSLFLDFSYHCWIGSLGFLLGLLGLLLFGFVEFLFNFFGLGFRCWMHRLFGLLESETGYFIDIYCIDT